MATTDRIEKHVLLKASRTKVWNAIADAKLFGQWFGVELDGPFVAGEPATGRIAPTQMDREVAKLQGPHTGKPFRIVVDRIDPMTHFSFRWHPFAIDASKDYAHEPMTLVELSLADAPGGAGTQLSIVESGFDQVPLARRAAAFAANDGGWAHQCNMIRMFVEREA
jgi:uncharacterized protein YndB with AHSA1/START domain